MAMSSSLQANHFGTVIGMQMFTLVKSVFRIKGRKYRNVL